MMGKRRGSNALQIRNHAVLSLLRNRGIVRRQHPLILIGVLIANVEQTDASGADPRRCYSHAVVTT
jgi:hypothetical protein